MSRLPACDATDSHANARMRGDERRVQLIRVAMGLFARKGFNGTTTKEIAATAGVTEALIFRHFPNKEALYEAILRWQIHESGSADMLETIRRFAEERDDDSFFRTLIRSTIVFHRKNPDFHRLMLYSALEGHDLADTFREEFVKPLHDFVCAYIELRQREGAFNGLDPAAAVRAVMAMPLHHSLTSNLFKCSMLDISDDTAAEEFARAILDGLRRCDAPRETTA